MLHHLLICRSEVPFEYFRYCFGLYRTVMDIFDNIIQGSLGTQFAYSVVYKLSASILLVRLPDI